MTFVLIERLFAFWRKHFHGVASRASFFKGLCYSSTKKLTLVATIYLNAWESYAYDSKLHKRAHMVAIPWAWIHHPAGRRELGENTEVLLDPYLQGRSSRGRGEHKRCPVLLGM